MITSDASMLGRIDGTEVDTDQWKVTHIRIDLTDDAIRSLGMKKPFMGGIRICLPVSYVTKLGDVATLKIPLAEVKNVPECKTK